MVPPNGRFGECNGDKLPWYAASEMREFEFIPGKDWPKAGSCRYRM